MSKSKKIVEDGPVFPWPMKKVSKSKKIVKERPLKGPLWPTEAHPERAVANKFIPVAKTAAYKQAGKKVLKLEYGRSDYNW